MNSHITKDDINEAYLKFLIFLDKKVGLSATYKNKGALAVADTEGHQQKLLSKVLINMPSFYFCNINSFVKAVARVQRYLFSTLVGYRSFAERKTRQQELVPLGYAQQKREKKGKRKEKKDD